MGKQKYDVKVATWCSCPQGHFGIGVFREEGRYVARGAVVQGHDEENDIDYIRSWGGLMDIQALAEIVASCRQKKSSKQKGESRPKE